MAGEGTMTQPHTHTHLHSSLLKKAFDVTLIEIFPKTVSDPDKIAQQFSILIY